MVCNRNWHILGNPKLVCHPARLIKDGRYVDLSMDIMHLKDLLVLFGSEGSVLTLFLLSPKIIMLCHCSSTVTKNYLLVIIYGTKGSLCVDVPLNKHSFIHCPIFFLLLDLTYGLSWTIVENAYQT